MILIIFSIYINMNSIESQISGLNISNDEIMIEIEQSNKQYNASQVDDNNKDFEMKNKQNIDFRTTYDKVDMRNLLGYLNQSDWIWSLNIGNIMQISPLTMQDIYTTSSIEYELSRELVLEKI